MTRKPIVPAKIAKPPPVEEPDLSPADEEALKRAEAARDAWHEACDKIASRDAHELAVLDYLMGGDLP